MFGSLDRSGILAIAAEAADVSASAEPSSGDTRQALGRRFSIALPFGCEGPLRDDQQDATGWRYDESSQALRVQFAPVTWRTTDWRFRSEDEVSFEGFWIARPWTTSEACPVPTDAEPRDGGPITPPGQTLAIGQAVDGDASAPQAGTKPPYVAVVRVPPADLRAERGFAIRLKGRLAVVRYGGPVGCVQPGGSEQRPICLIGATFDEIVLENAATGETLARWSGIGKGRVGSAAISNLPQP